MAGSRKIYRCEWPITEDDNKPCGELVQGRQRFDYHVNAHKRTAPKVQKVVAPTPHRVYHGG